MIPSLFILSGCWNYVAEGDTDSDTGDTDTAETDADTDADADSDADADGDTDTDTGSGGQVGTPVTVTVTWTAQADGAPSCQSWLNAGAAVANGSCDLNGATYGELWVPVPAVVDNTLSNGELESDVSTTHGADLRVNGIVQASDTWQGEYYLCAQWFATGAASQGTFYIDGVEVTPSFSLNGVGGYDCILRVP